MIAIASSAPAERSALAVLCADRGWNSIECRSVRDVIRIVRRVSPKVMLVRFQLQDGFSDDVFDALSTAPGCSATKTIVMLPADAPAAIEARQVALGADCVQRDPVRTEVLLAYIEKFRRKSPRVSTTRSSLQLYVSGATLNALDRTLRFHEKSTVLTPREATLVELLVGSTGEVVTYEELYDDILGQRFRGDTSNMRVLLAKLSSSASQIGLAFRRCVDVIPKTGYRYNMQDADSLNTVATRADP